MEIKEFEGVMNLVEAHIDAAKKQLEKKTRVESAERDLKRVRAQLAALMAKMEDLQRLAGQTPVDGRITEAIRKLKEEEVRASKLLADLGVQETQEPTAPKVIPETERTRLPEPISNDQKEDLFVLTDEVDGTDLQVLDIREAKLLVAIWGLRWRMFCERFPIDRAKADRDVRRTCAKIHTANNSLGAAFLPCMDGSARRDWAEMLRKAEADLSDVRAAKEEASEAFEDLRDFMAGNPAMDVEENAKRLRHLVREAGRYPNYRDLVAEVVAPRQGFLGQEFAFLWDAKVAAPANETPKAKMTNRDVAARVLRRLINKGRIGGQYAPTAMVPKGFPPHDADRAKEVIEAMLRSGVLLEHKTTAGEGCVSVSPEFVPAVKGFLGGKPLGAALVDVWCDKTEA